MLALVVGECSEVAAAALPRSRQRASGQSSWRPQQHARIEGIARADGARDLCLLDLHRRPHGDLAIAPHRHRAIRVVHAGKFGRHPCREAWRQAVSAALQESRPPGAMSMPVMLPAS